MHPWLKGPQAPGIPALLSVASTGTNLRALDLSHFYLSPGDLYAVRKEGIVPCNKNVKVLRARSVLNELDESRGGLSAFCALLDALYPNLDIHQSHAHEPAGTEHREVWAKILRSLREHRRSRLVPTSS